MTAKDASKGLAAIIGANIRRARDEAQLTQNELAKRLGGKLTNQTISDWERGVNRPSDENWGSLVAVLGYDFAWFLSDHDDKPVAA